MNQLSRPLDSFELPDLGRVEVRDIDGNVSPGEFEMFRFRSTIIGRNDEDEIIERAEAVEAMIQSAPSEYDARLMKERLACLTGGIAKLTVVGSSNGELRERKDRADDAVQAVKGAIKYGALPGGGWTLLRVSQELAERYPNNDIVARVLESALEYPVRKLFENTGAQDNDVKARIRYICHKMSGIGRKSRYAEVLSLPGYEPVRATKAGLLDSVPAVLEAIRSSISIAALIGTLGGIVVFERDEEHERSEAAANEDFVRNAGISPANERW
jgi:chaperonin GroEL